MRVSVFQILSGRKPRNSFHHQLLKFGVCLFGFLKSKFVLHISCSFLSKSVTTVIMGSVLLENKYLDINSAKKLIKVNIIESLIEDLTELHSVT